ncbi:MAG: hypothetical protein KA479_03495 [Saprospiraceae bacterium]|nr:hypothetical protein [Saprospiraceae bacterium]
MSKYTFIVLFTVSSIVFFTSCSTLDKASVHGFTSGYYTLDVEKTMKNVYVDVTDEQIDVYHQLEKKPDKDKFLTARLNTSDSALLAPLTFRKKSIDIDMTTILFKYRPSVYGLPPQLTADLNVALYVGMRHDNYKIINKMDPLGKSYPKITNLGYDFGFFAGPGITPISSFTSNNRTSHEYSGMIIQMGVAGFLESNIASFGIAVGFDYLLNRDREIWIYTNKPWLGFVVGIALN